MAWYIDSGGLIDGPLSSAELRDRAAAGRLRPDDRVSPDRATWRPASTLADLAFPPAGDPQAGEATVESDEHVLPGYELLAKIGAGACGVVFKARQLKLDRVVAVKTVAFDKSVSPTVAARFDREAVALAKLRHPNIVQVFDAGHLGGRVFFAMELLEGEDLDRRIARAGPLDERAAWWVARQTAVALAHAAGQGIYHRDVKPANLFLCPPPTGFGLPPGVPMVKVTDFGLAHTRRAADAPADRLTAVGVIVGTPIYMAPEQFSQSDVDHRADTYALGATVFHALTGRPPFAAPTVFDVMARKLEGAPRLGPPVSNASADLVAAMMARDPAARIAGYDDLIARIDALPVMAAGTAAVPAAPRLGGHPGRGPRIARIVAAVALLALVAAAAVYFRPGCGSPGVPPTAPTEFESTGVSRELIDRESVFPWTGPGVGLEKDAEQTAVITGTKFVNRQVPLYPSYRLLVVLDLHQAEAAEVTVAVFEGPAASAPRLAVRLSRAGGAVLGRRAGDAGAFERIGPAVPYPTAEELAGKLPYQEIRCERAGGWWTVLFRNRPLGELADDGGRVVNELRVAAEGGPVRIDSAKVEELRPK
jgi:hypothetical protein